MPRWFQTLFLVAGLGTLLIGIAILRQASLHSLRAQEVTQTILLIDGFRWAVGDHILRWRVVVGILGDNGEINRPNPPEECWFNLSTRKLHCGDGEQSMTQDVVEHMEAHLSDMMADLDTLSHNARTRERAIK